MRAIFITLLIAIFLIVGLGSQMMEYDQTMELYEEQSDYDAPMMEQSDVALNYLDTMEPLSDVSPSEVELTMENTFEPLDIELQVDQDIREKGSVAPEKTPLSMNSDEDMTMEYTFEPLETDLQDVQDSQETLFDGPEDELQLSYQNQDVLLAGDNNEEEVQDGAAEEEDKDEESVQVLFETEEKFIDGFKGFTMEVMNKTLNDICEQNEVIVICGVSISKCSVDWSKKNIILKGTVFMFGGKLSGKVEVEIINTANSKNKDYYLSIALSQKSTFRISNLISSLKNTALDSIKFRKPKIIIATTNQNSFKAKPGVTFKVEILPSLKGQNQYIQSISNFLGKDVYLTAEMSLTGKTDINELKNATQRTYTLTMTANQFRAGTNRVQCTKASIAISNEKPHVKVVADCNLNLKSNSNANIQLTYSARTATSFSVSGSMKGQVRNAFKINGATLTKGGVSGTFNKASLTALKFNGEIELRKRKYSVEGDVFKGEYTFFISKIVIRELIISLGISSSLANKTPNFTMKNVKITIQTSTKDSNPSFKIEAELDGKVVNFNIRAKTLLNVDNKKVSIKGSLTDTTFKVGPITLTKPEIGVDVKLQTPGSSVFLSGVTSLWSMKGLITKVEIVNEKGKTGYTFSVRLEKTFKISQLSSALRNTPLKSLQFKNPELKYSSFPVKYVDNVSRKGAVLQAMLKLEAMAELVGVKILFGGKLNVLPVILPFGGSRLSVVSPQNMEMVAILPFSIPIKCKYIQFLSPVSMSIGLGMPPSFGLNLDLVIRFPVDNQPLPFRTAFKLSKLGADAFAETKKEWRNPFGLKGLTVKKLALDVGIIYKKFAATGIPSRLGVIGEFVFPGVGNVKIATLADIGKGQFILSASIDRFGVESLRQLLSSLGVNIPHIFLPPLIEFRNVKVYVAPNEGRIGSVHFQRGYNLEGRMFLFKQLFSEVKAVVSMNKGIQVDGRVVARKIGPLDIHDSTIDFKLTSSQQHFIINAKVSLRVVFEIASKAVKIFVDRNRVNFHVENTIYKLTATASTQNPTDFTMEGTIKAAVLNDIRKALDKDIGGIRKHLNTLKSGVDKAKKAFNTVKAVLDKFKLPNLCPRSNVAAVAATTLAYNKVNDVYDNDDETQVLIKRLFRRASKPVTRVVKRGIDFTKKALEEARKQACKVAQSQFTILASNVRTATNMMQDAIKKHAAQAGLYRPDILNGEPYRLHSISFKAGLAAVTKNKSINVTVDITVYGKREKISLNLSALSKVREIHKQLLPRIVKKSSNNPFVINTPISFRRW